MTVLGKNCGTRGRQDSAGELSLMVAWLSVGRPYTARAQAAAAGIKRQGKIREHNPGFALAVRKLSTTIHKKPPKKAKKLRDNIVKRNNQGGWLHDNPQQSGGRAECGVGIEQNKKKKNFYF